MSRKKSFNKTSFLNKNNFFKILFSFTSVAFAIVIFLYSNNLKSFPCANSITCINDLSGQFDEHQTKGEFMGSVVEIPEINTTINDKNLVLGKSTLDNKRIYINLANQTLYAVDGRKVVYKFIISSGKWGRTPTGKFKIWIKLNATRMSGGSQELGTYYDLPNVPWTMYFYNNEILKERGFGIHGAYWHNNFGQPMSHGCINMKIEEAKILYEWAQPISSGYTTYASDENPGTEITIFGTAPDY